MLQPKYFFLQSFKSLRVQLEMRRKQVDGALQSTQKDGMLTVDQALVKQAWERVANRVRKVARNHHLYPLLYHNVLDMNSLHINCFEGTNKFTRHSS